MWKTITPFLSGVNIGSNEKGTKQTGLPHKMLWSSPIYKLLHEKITSKEDENLPVQAAASPQNNH